MAGNLIVLVHAWDDPHAAVVAEVKKATIPIGSGATNYSYGNVALQNECNKSGLIVNFSQHIAPVNYAGLDLQKAVTPNSNPFWIPISVKKVSSYRTVNPYYMLPWDSDIDCSIARGPKSSNESPGEVSGLWIRITRSASIASTPASTM